MTENCTMIARLPRLDGTPSMSGTDLFARAAAAGLGAPRAVSAQDTPSMIDLLTHGGDGSQAEHLSRAEWQADFNAFFSNGYGPVWFPGSIIVPDAVGAPVGLILCVMDAVWELTPPGPFVTDLFVHPANRRRAIADGLLRCVAHRAWAAGLPTLSLRVDVDNLPAIRLYEKLGFCRWSGHERA